MLTYFSFLDVIKILPRILIILSLYLSSNIAAYQVSDKGWQVVPGLAEPGSFVGEVAELNFSVGNPKVREMVPETAEAVEFTLEKIFTLSEKEYEDLAGSEPELYLQYVSNVHSVYLNNYLVRRSGIIVDGIVTKDAFHRNLRIPIKPGLLALGENRLTVQISGALNDEVYLNAPVELNDKVTNMAKNDSMISSMLAFLYTFLGFYHILLYSKRRVETYNLWFGLFTIFLSLYIFIRSSLIYEFDLPLLWQKRMEWSTIAFTTAFATMFFSRYFYDSASSFSKFLKRVAVGYLAAMGVLQFVNLFLANGLLSVTLRIWQLSVLIMFFVAVSCIVRAIIRKNGDGGRMLYGLVAMTLTAFWDILGANGTFGLKNHELSKFGFMIFVIGITFVLANRFLRVHNEAEELSGSLERKVEERTEKLNQTLKDVQKLKEKQDGDYFLTSLLMQPLGVTHVRSEFVKIESFIKQKKDFTFRKRELEIGGDINIAYDLTLQRRNYVLFLNGDAMGKSIQGAGGAIVLGTVFQSIVERTTNSELEQSLYPERWLKNTFIEMHKVFSSFDGSMLMSVVMGLLDPANGALYFINAEHPYTVLFRDNKASFLEEDVPLRKLGTTIISTRVNIKVESLEEGDSIVLGSDGRDDLLLGYDDQGIRIINEDETLFLRVLEEAEGDLENSFHKLKDKGEITDDTSLLKITLTKKGSPPVNSQLETETLAKVKEAEQPLQLLKRAIEEQPGSIRLINEYLATALEKNEAEFIYDATMVYLSAFPHDNAKMRETTARLVGLSEFDKALDFAERYRLRFPDDRANLEDLVKIYENKGKNQLAAEYKERLKEVVS